MAIWTLGINHKTAPVAVRERVSFDPATMPEVLSEVQSLDPVSEVVILSTCNRTEIYCSAEQLNEELIAGWLSQHHDIELTELHSALYCLNDDKAVQHTMRVASGLDSLVLGEPQILGQMKSAFAVAQEAGTVGSELGRLFRQTFSIAKRVRTDTAIGENPVSVAFAAVRMAQHIFADMSSSSALLIGAGETIELVARHLHQAGVKQMTLANRTLARAQALAQEFHAEAVLLEDIPNVLPRADIVISSTASPLPILGKGAVEKAQKTRRHKPMFMVDIAVPRDIEEEVGELSDVYLYTVDDLRNIIEENVRSREDAAKQAEELILAGVDHFMRELKALNAVQTLTDLRSSVDQLREEQLAKALKQLQNGADAEKVLRQFAHTFSNKVLHAPTSMLRKAGSEGRLEVLDWTRELFNLNTENDAAPGAVQKPAGDASATDSE
ncbi:MAG: glutamyl-tRNA reductase [Oceanospirillaceae bacterium]|uniref:glutamyl-tRNA reductase n=1 Tax=unclassified Thalassolituus TaxID=2624967 RepID=UPI000C66FE7D|nr:MULTISPECIES: glutamyl-tRNA reductase [unclassified Thalassolituus]MAS26433.1 glutamyl-tRNA reductase [Oceanospirillaceae bacterium]MAX98252.1 glutamyl-tRNA reductase [Oceanospirillaceae bacterium]MBL34324.1 glutamyl-tRNA reductase [Oceanospirillaceae bacterium]MBS54167.1 glutamyl-tRNA reductase [Oceanospirillaceae bacterium]